MTDIFEYLFDLFGNLPNGEIILNLFAAIFVLIVFSTLLNFLFAIVAQFFRR